MKSSTFACMLTSALALFSVSCDKSDEKKDIIRTEPAEKVARIYTSSHTLTEIFNPFTNTWMDTEKDIERQLSYEFTWNRDRLVSLKVDNITFTFTYDADGRIVHAENDTEKLDCYDFTYNAQGRVSQVYSYVENSNGELESYDSFDLFWEDDRLLKIEEDKWTLFSDGSEYSSESTHTFVWDGGNISSTHRHEVDSNNSTEDTDYTYEYTDIPNPLRGFVMCLDCFFGIIWTFEGIDCLCSNLVSKVVGNNNEVSFEYATTGNRVNSFKKRYYAGDDVLMRMTIDTVCELEYAD